MKEWFSQLAPGTQILLILIGLVLVYYVFKTGGAFFERASAKAETLGEVAALNSQGIRPTYSSIQYKSFANQLYYAVEGLGTDEEMVYSIFRKMKNDLDIINLTSAYDVRDGYDLQAWLRGDMGSEDMQQLNTILSNKGISKSF